MERDGDTVVQLVVAADAPVQSEGVTQGENMTFDAPVLKPVEPTHSLLDISKERVLFTHAPLLIHGGLTPDPLEAFQAENKLHSPITLLRMPQKIFSGLATRSPDGRVIDDSWEYHLFAIDKQDFPALYAFFGQIAALDRLRGLVICALGQIIPVFDVIAQRRQRAMSKVTPVAPVYAVGLNTNRGQIYFKPPRIPSVMNTVKIVSSNQPDPQIVNLAAALLTEQPRPLVTEASTEKPAEMKIIVDPTELVKVESP